MSYPSGTNGSSSSNGGNTPIEQFVSAVTDALHSGKGNLDSLVEHYATSINTDEANQLLSLIQRLYAVLVPVKPSRRFSARLKQDLMGQPERTMIERIRYLPPRVQIAAGVAVVAGLMILARRRVASVTDAADVAVSTDVVAAS